MKKTPILLRLSLMAFAILLTSACTDKNSIDSKTEHKSTKEMTNSDHITLINSFEVPAGKLEESISYWEACRDFLKKQPGYISTKLHQSLKDDARFLLVNVAMWTSPKAFTDATNKMRKELGIAPVEGLKPNASLYKVIRE